MASRVRRIMERWKKASIPHRFLSSILYQMAPLAVLEYGGGPEHLSISFSLMYLGLMIGNLAWTKVLTPKKRHIPGIALGHLSLVLPALIASYPSVYAALASSFLIALLSPISYFASLFYAYDRLKDPSKASSSYESVSGWSWLAGLIAGGLVLHFTSLEVLAKLTVALNLLFTPIEIVILKIPVFRILRKAYEEELGLLPLLEEGIEAVQRAEEEALMWTVASISRVARGTLFHRPSYIILSMPKVGMPFSIKVLIASIGLGLAYPQLVGVEKYLGLDSSQIYLLSALSSFVSSSFYSRADKGDEVRNLDISLLIRSFILFSVSAVIIGLFPPLEYFSVFMVLSGATWSFIVVSISRRGLKVSSEYLGQINFVRSLGWAIGALAGGFLAGKLGFHILYASSAGLVLVASLIKTRRLEEVKKTFLFNR